MKEIEVRLFITFLFISAFFSVWTSWNEESNLLVLKSLVEEGNFYLEKYRNLTGDLNCFNHHCFVLRWGLTLLSSFIYAFLSFIKDEEVVKFLLSVFVSGLFFSLSTLLIYKISKFFLRRKNQRIAISLFYGFSTLTFQQSRIFSTHSSETFFLTLLLYLLFRLLKKRNNTIEDSILLGAITGFGLLITYTFRIVPFLLFLILIIRGRRKEAIIFSTISSLIFLGTFLGTLTFFGENVYGDSFDFLNFLIPRFETKGTAFFPEGWEETTFPFSAFLQLLFFPSKGVLFYYPILFFSFIGFLVRNRYNLEKYIIFLSSVLIIILISILTPAWWAGWISYGPSRALTILMPLFVLGIMSFVEKFGFKLLIPFLLISILNNFLLLQYGEDKISALTWEDYKYKMENFQILSNPLLDHYLPLTLINGPRSILLENLIINKKISIDFKHYFNPVTPEFIPPGSLIIKKFEVYLFFIPEVGIVVLKLPWLSLFILGLALTIIWKDYIFSKIKINPTTLILIFCSIFLLLFIRIRNTAYGDGWCAPQWNENEKKIDEGRWIGRNATLFLFSNEEKTLKFMVESLSRSQLEIYLNYKIVGNYTIEKKRIIYQRLNKGINEIKFVAKDNCVEPWLNGINCDLNCINLKISDISFV